MGMGERCLRGERGGVDDAILVVPIQIVWSGHVPLDNPIGSVSNICDTSYTIYLNYLFIYGVQYGVYGVSILL